MLNKYMVISWNNPK